MGEGDEPHRMTHSAFCLIRQAQNYLKELVKSRHLAIITTITIAMCIALTYPKGFAYSISVTLIKISKANRVTKAGSIRVWPEHLLSVWSRQGSN